MLEVVKINYLINDVEYIYEDGIIVGVHHTDTGVIIPDENGPYTEEELREILKTQGGVEH